jgi:hypothetical protein
MRNRVISGLLLGAFSATLFAFAPAAAVAGPEGRKNTALLLGAGTIYSVLKRKTVPALALGAGTYLAYRRYRSAKEQRRVRRAYASGYRTASYRSYRPSYYRTAGYRSSYSRRYRPTYARTASYRSS